MGVVKSGKRIRRIQDIEKDLPPRLRKEPKAGDNPLKRPYPPHSRDIEVLYSLLSDIPRDIPTEFSKRDQRTAVRPQGVLYFHTLDIQNIKLSPYDFIPGAAFCIYVEYECQGVIKASYPVYSHRFSKIRIDHFVHMGAVVSEIRNDEANDFVIHVYAFQNPEKHWLIGSQVMHLYNFVRDIHGITTVEIQDDLSYYVGRVTFEFAWAYGSAGYGHSNQLRNTKNPALDSVCHSMFPRIAPNRKDLIDSKFRVRVPKRLRLINLHSLITHATQKGKKGVSQKPGLESKRIIFRRAKFARGRPVHVALNLDIHQKFMENDFNESYGEFICLRNRSERLQHLTRMMEGRLRDRFEDEHATDLFHPILDLDDSRAVLNENLPPACPPGYMEHHSHPKICPPKYPVKLSEKDDQFISGITSAPRFSGYLAQVFGFAEKAKMNQVQPVERWEYEVPPHAFLGGGDRETDAMTWLQRLRYYKTQIFYKMVVWFRDTWEYIFPSETAKTEMTLPEISVTLPSPSDSTTEFYSHCVQEKVYPEVDAVTQSKRMATGFIRTARRQMIGDETDSEVEEERVKDTIKTDVEEDDEGWETDAELEELHKRIKNLRESKAVGGSSEAQHRMKAKPLIW